VQQNFIAHLSQTLSLPAGNIQILNVVPGSSVVTTQQSGFTSAAAASSNSDVAKLATTVPSSVGAGTQIGAPTVTAPAALSPSGSTNNDSSSGLSGGAIAGIVIGVIVLIVVLAVVIKVFVSRRSGNQVSETGSMMNSSKNVKTTESSSGIVFNNDAFDGNSNDFDA
jgi:cell wall integrity and stress response component